MCGAAFLTMIFYNDKTNMNEYIYKEIAGTQRCGTLMAKLLHVWEDSVKASHHFLTGNDVESLKPYVVEGIKAIPVLYIAFDCNEPVAFMGMAEKKIEMLFVSPKHFGHGIGKHLVEWAITTRHASFVDANEQNPQAVGFYKHLGFVTFERTETDDQGNPFPILRMKLAKE